MDIRPSLCPLLLESAMSALVKDEYDNVSYEVLNIGAANILPAYSCEIGVPMDGRHIEAVERIIEVAAEHRRLGDVYQSSPISFRFVKASPRLHVDDARAGHDDDRVDRAQGAARARSSSPRPTRRRCASSAGARTGGSSTRSPAATV